ncbi:MAG: hypothetical protein JNK57_00785 [Planctomycetaceae bacterium]|nr:hypothetical protein [Planctomycetaceae bacterium]
MNYLAHAYRFLERPTFALGTMIPDFMNMVDRRARVRRRHAERLIDMPDLFVADLAAGIVQHHCDDYSFHNSPSFLELQEQLSRHLRTTVPDPRGLRSWFTAHIGIEMLLDWTIMDQYPDSLTRLYQVFEETDCRQLCRAVEWMAGCELPKFEPMHAFFLTERFLYDYRTDVGLFYRINRILVRVGLEPFQPDQITWVPIARQWVASAHDSLLAPVVAAKE